MKSNLNSKNLLIRYFLIISVSVNVFAVNISNYINKNNCDKIIDKEVFTICYDYKMKGAKYVTYTLKGNLVNKHNIKKRPSFYTEKNIAKRYRSYSRDYIKTGYDRGHLANDASFDYDVKFQRKTYTMANIIPQAPRVNRKTWIKAEKLERDVAVKLGSVSVINGVIYNKNPKRIGKNGIAVPSAFWKMLYNNRYNYKKCFLYENDNNIDVKRDKLRNHLVNCNKIKYL